MASEERAQPEITSLPRVEDLPVAEQGYDADRVRDAFDSFRRHVVQLQAQLRVLQAAGHNAQVEPTGHAVRMDALHLIREAAAFADVLENDAQRASATQYGKTEQEVRRRQSELNRREAEASGAKLLEQSRHQATELTNSARAEVEQTLEWARAQANAIMVRAQQGAEQLLSAAGLGDEAVSGVSDAIVRAAQVETETAAPAELPERSAPVAAAPEPESPSQPERQEDDEDSPTPQ